MDERLRRLQPLLRRALDAIGLRGQVLALLLLVSLPLLVLLINADAGYRGAGDAEAEARTLQVALTARGTPAAILEAARSSAQPVARGLAGEDVRALDSDACQAHLDRAWLSGAFTSIRIATPEGDVQCVRPAAGEVEPLDGDEQALGAGAVDPVIGAARTPAGVDQVVLPVYQAITDGDGAVTGMVRIDVDSAALLPTSLVNTLPSGASIMLIDRAAEVVAEAPRQVTGGTEAAGGIPAPEGLAPGSAEAAEDAAGDAIYRAHVAVDGAGSVGLWLAAPRDAMGGVSTILFQRGVLLPLLAWIAFLGIGWIWANAALARPITLIHRAVAALGRGERGVRVGESAASGELRQLVRSVDALAASGGARPGARSRDSGGRSRAAQSGAAAAGVADTGAPDTGASDAGGPGERLHGEVERLRARGWPVELRDALREPSSRAARSVQPALRNVVYEVALDLLASVEATGGAGAALALSLDAGVEGAWVALHDRDGDHAGPAAARVRARVEGLGGDVEQYEDGDGALVVQATIPAARPRSG